MQSMSGMRVNSISVIMTAQNAEAFIAEAIESVLNQSFDDFEFIIVNDSSTDNTRSIICSYNDVRILLIDNVHDAISSLNTGLKAANGKYVALMNVNDICHIDRLKLQHSFMEEFPQVTVHSSWMCIFSKKTPCVILDQKTSGIIEQPLIQLFNNNFIVNSTSIIRNSFIKEHNLLFANYTNIEEYIYWLEIAKQGGIFYVDSQPLVYKRITDSMMNRDHHSISNGEQDSINTQATSKIKKEILRFLCNHYAEMYPSLMSLYHSFYELSDQKLITEKELVNFFYSLFSKNKDVFSDY